MVLVPVVRGSGSGSEDAGWWAATQHTVQKPEPSLPRGPLVTSSPAGSFRRGVGFWSTDLSFYMSLMERYSLQLP